MPLTITEKLTPYNDGKKRKMKMTKLTAIALTGRGANPLADVTFFKSEDKPEEEVNKRFGITDDIDGHQHVIDLMGPQGIVSRGNTTWDDGHSHEWVKRDDGSVVILSAEGHTHTIIEQIEVSMKSDIPKEGILASLQKRDDSKETVGNEEDPNMPDTATKEAEDLVKANETIAGLEAKLEVANKISAMNDGQEAHYQSLDTDGQTAFLAKSEVDREADVAKANEADKVIYKSADGEEFRQSDDPRLVAMAKRGDEDRKNLIKSNALRENDRLEKTADTELQHLPGDLKTRVALIKAVEGIEDTDMRDEAMKALKAQNAKLAPAFDTVGTTAVPQVDVAEKTAADGELDKLAKAYALEKNVDYFDAYQVVSDANPDLLEKAMA